MSKSVTNGAHESPSRITEPSMSLSEIREHFKEHSKVREYKGHNGKVHTVGWNSDGRRLASGSFDKTVAVYPLEGSKLQKPEHIYKGHNDSVDQLCWHPSHPDLFATASGDKTVRIWDAKAQKGFSPIPTKGENINISWSPDGNSIAVGNKEDLITFIDPRNLKVSQEVPFKFEVNEICWNPASNLFFLTNGEGCVCIYSYPDMQELHVLKAHPVNCICIEFHPSGEYFAVGSADAVVSLWDLKELACVRTFHGLEWPVRAISFNYDGSLIASASEDLRIDIDHVETGEDVLPPADKVGAKKKNLVVDSPTFTVAFHPTRNLLAYACDDKDSRDRERDAGTIKVFGFAND